MKNSKTVAKVLHIVSTQSHGLYQGLQTTPSIARHKKLTLQQGRHAKRGWSKGKKEISEKPTY